MIQDIYPHELINAYNKDAVPAEDSPVICFSEQNEFILHENQESKLIYPTVKELGAEKEYIYLFNIDGKDHFFLLNAPETLPEGCIWMPFKNVRELHYGPQHRRFGLYTAKHLHDWYAITQFCGKCGGKMKHSETERAMRCQSCRNTVYPRIMPAVIVGVCNKDRILLTKYRTGFRENALIAGFTEIGESLEGTVAREVMEEAGIKVKNIRYYKSQPWGSVSDILMGFYCDVDGDDTIRMDTNELKYAEWVEREDIVLQSNADSLTNEMMTRFKEGTELKA